MSVVNGQLLSSLEIRSSVYNPGTTSLWTTNIIPKGAVIGVLEADETKTTDINVNALLFLRLIQHSTKTNMQNIMARHVEDKVYLQTSRDVSPNRELICDSQLKLPSLEGLPERLLRNAAKRPSQSSSEVEMREADEGPAIHEPPSNRTIFGEVREDARQAMSTDELQCHHCGLEFDNEDKKKTAQRENSTLH